MFVYVFVNTNIWSERDLNGLNGCFPNWIGKHSETFESLKSKEQTEDGDGILENEGESKWLWKDVTDLVSLRSFESFKLEEGSRS